MGLVSARLLCGYITVLYFVCFAVDGRAATQKQYPGPAVQQWLLTEKVPDSPLDYRDIVDLDSHSAKSHPVHLSLMGTVRLTPIDKLSFNRGINNQEVTLNAELKQKLLPDMEFEFFIDGGLAIPTSRDLQLTTHPYWHYFIGIGNVQPVALPPKAEHDSQSQYQLSFPFALVEKNQNCTHNGVLTFLTDKRGNNSHFYYQITSETCVYFKQNFWGMGQGKLTLTRVEHRQLILEQLATQRRAQLPGKPIAELALLQPSLPLSQIQLKEKLGRDATTVGVIFDGTHYRGGCQTRSGQYPFCQQMVLPSYSLAKSIFPGLVSYHLSQLYPDVMSEKVSDWLSECPREKWQGVTFNHLLNMTTGLYHSTVHGVDEASDAKLAFFLGQTHREKVSFACQHYPRQVPGGQQFVYHTSDTYLLGIALNRFYQHHQGKDKNVFDDFLVANIFSKLFLSDVASRSLKTTDRDQALAGYGLFFTADDLAKIMDYVNREVMPFLRQNLKESVATPFDNIRYLNSFWLYNAASKLACNRPTYIPYMSGYGGLAAVFIRPELQFYYVSDSNRYDWQSSLQAFEKIAPICVN